MRRRFLALAVGSAVIAILALWASRSGEERGDGRAHAHARAEDDGVPAVELVAADADDGMTLAAVSPRAETPTEPDSPEPPSASAEAPKPDGVPFVRGGVRDAAGAPLADVPVGIELRKRDAGRGVLDLLGTTGEDGIARFEFGPQSVHPSTLDGRYTGYAGLGFPNRREPELGFDLLAPPADTVWLTAPPMGFLELTVLDAAGARVADELSRIEAGPAPEGYELASASAPRTHGWRRKSFVRFPVEVGIRLNVAATVSGYERLQRTVDGPRSAGETAAVVLQAEGRLPTLLARLRDEAGGALADSDITLRYGYQGRFEDDYTRRFSTDASGVLRAELTPPRFDYERAWAEIVHAPQAGRPLSGSVALPVPLPHGEIDLGDLFLQPAPLLFRGRVVDVLGEPIYRMRVELATVRPGPDGHLRAVTWPRRAVTEEDGSFACYGELPPGDYALQVSGTGYVRSSFVPIELGAEDVEIRLRRPGTVRGELRVPQGIEVGEFRVVALPRAGGVRSSRTTPGRDGGFVLDGLGPGTYDVEVEIESDKEPVLRIEDVVIRDDETTELGELKLAGLARGFELLVRAPPGAPEPDGLVILRAPGEAAVERLLEFRGGRVAFASRREAVDVEVRVHGYRAAVVEGLRGSGEVQLEPGIEVHLRLADGFEVPAAPLRLCMGLRDVEGIDRNRLVDLVDGKVWQLWLFEAGHFPAVGTSRQVSITLPRPGDYEAGLFLYNADQAGGGSSIRAESQRLELGPDDAGRVIEVSPDPERFQSALEWVRKQ